MLGAIPSPGFFQRKSPFPFLSAAYGKMPAGERNLKMAFVPSVVLLQRQQQQQQQQ